MASNGPANLYQASAARFVHFNIRFEILERTGVICFVTRCRLSRATGDKELAISASSDEVFSTPDASSEGAVLLRWTVGGHGWPTRAYMDVFTACPEQRYRSLDAGKDKADK
jgi:hypothetical protein